MYWIMCWMLLYKTTWYDWLPSILEKVIPLHCIGHSLHNHGPLSFLSSTFGVRRWKVFWSQKLGVVSQLVASHSKPSSFIEHNFTIEANKMTPWHDICFHIQTESRICRWPTHQPILITYRILLCVVCWLPLAHVLKFIISQGALDL